MLDMPAYLHIGMQALGLWSYKALTFVLMGVSGIFLDAILKRNGEFGKHRKRSMSPTFKATC